MRTKEFLDPYRLTYDVYSYPMTFDLVIQSTCYCCRRLAWYFFDLLALRLWIYSFCLKLLRDLSEHFWDQTQTDLLLSCCLAWEVEASDGALWSRFAAGTRFWIARPFSCFHCLSFYPVRGFQESTSNFTVIFHLVRFLSLNFSYLHDWSGDYHQQDWLIEEIYWVLFIEHTRIR